MIRLDVTWSTIAPTVRPAGFVASEPSSPGYDWTTLDAQVRELSGAGFKILVDVWGAPSWAEGPDQPRSAPAGTWKPSPSAFGAFATALATRYSGSFADPLSPLTDLPRVVDWQAWNEPNLATNLTPQWIRTSKGKLQAESPIIDRKLQNAFYMAVKHVSQSNLVIQGGTAPYGDPPGGQRIPPVDFDEDLFCLNSSLQKLSCPDPVHLDALDHHPYGIYGPTWHALDPGDVAVPDIVKLTRVLHAAERVGTVLPRGPKQVWCTEISWDTKPPNPQAIPVVRAAHWLEQSLYVLWSQGVDTVLWWQLADSPPIPSYAVAYEAGVYFLDGRTKPGATAFRFPFLTNRVSPSLVEAWGRAPVSGTVSIEILAHRNWRLATRLQVRADQVFQAEMPLTGAESLRAQLAGKTSLAWNQGA